MATEPEIEAKYSALGAVLDERMRRLWAGAEAMSAGISVVARATGLARMTIRSGLREVRTGASQAEVVRVRRPGAGRKRMEELRPEILVVLDSLVDPATRGDPMSPLRWTCKSTRQLAAELKKHGHPMSPQKVGQMLRAMGYSLQSTRKGKEGASHPDRNAQFEHINEQVKAFQKRGAPVISVDTKKKELVGAFKNAGREWQPEGEPERVNIYDFIGDASGKAIPYGIYDLSKNLGWVNVGIDHDTAQFAASSIRSWWSGMGEKLYPEAKELLITADGGGSNGYRTHQWKAELQKIADDTGLRVSVSHFPPGASKWNKIEHRLFCHITQNWRGRPLSDFETIVQLIGNTRTNAGLRVRARLDRRKYPIELKVSKSEVASLRILRQDFHGEWNYTIVPRQTSTP